jgi:hypothetical protein
LGEKSWPAIHLTRDYRGNLGNQPVKESTTHWKTGQMNRTDNSQKKTYKWTKKHE